MSRTHNYDLGLIGNCAYMAHIASDSNVKWLCWPQFDSTFIFGSLLDSDGGEFSVESEKFLKSKQYYLENTNVLVTEIESEFGIFKVTDFAPRFAQYERYHKPLMLFRKVERVAGNPKIRIICKPKGEYGKTDPQTSLGSNHIRFQGLNDKVRLTTNIALNYILNEKEFLLTEPKYMVLSWGVPLEAPLESTFEEFYHKTVNYWRSWVAHSSIPPIFQQEVLRSALVLKLHQFEDTGAIIASGTTSLPEAPGEGRNWDYRYCWIRDTYYILSALNSLGHFEELVRYSHYIQNIALTNDDKIQPVYSITGETDLHEYNLDLKGYLKNQPVRIGNLAYKQTQNDVYGQILVSLLPLYVDHRFIGTHRNTSIELINRLLKGIEETLDKPDAGIWEYRGIEKKHCYTFLFHWAGANAASQIAKTLQNRDLLNRSIKCQKIASEFIEKCFDPKEEVYKQAIDDQGTDASLLQLITMGYLDPHSERSVMHLLGLEKELHAGNGLFYRYNHDDDFGKPSVAFMICGYWYVEALAITGQTEKAIIHLKKLLKFSNHLGLFSEDVDPNNGSLWGNFPQTYSHVGLINAVFKISKSMNLPSFIDKIAEYNTTTQKA